MRNAATPTFTTVFHRVIVIVSLTKAVTTRRLEGFLWTISRWAFPYKLYYRPIIFTIKNKTFAATI